MRFDLLSFILGFVVASVLYGALFFNRKRLSGVWDAIAERLKELRQNLTSNTETRYRKELVTSMQQQHLAASLLPLEDILVPPRFMREPPPITPDEEYEPDITEAIPAAPDLPFPAAVYDTPDRTLRDIGYASDNVIIVGDPGSGKSTALQALAIHAARRNPDVFPSDVFPLYIHLGDLDLNGPDKIDPFQTLVDLASIYVSPLSQPALPGLARTNLNRSRALILVDGFDELPTKQRLPALERFRQIFAAFDENRFVFASPFRFYQPLLDLGFAPVFMSGWAQRHIQELVGKWVAVWPSVLASQKRKRAGDIEPALVAGWLVGNTIGRSPFEITLKAWTGLAGDAEGARTVDWLKTFVRRLRVAPEIEPALEEMALQTLRESLYGITRDNLKSIINDVAAVVPDSERSSFDPLDLIDDLANRPGGLIRKRGASGLITFTHPLLRGYLAGRALSLEGSMGAQQLVQQRDNRDWQPVFPYFAALADATPVAAAFLKVSSDVLYTALFLMAAWLPDAPAKARWRGEILRRLSQVMLTAQAPFELRGRAAGHLVASQDENILKLFQQTLVSDDPLARQLGCVGLGALNDVTAVRKIASLLMDPDPYVRWAAGLSLGRIGNDDALEALTDALVDGSGDINAIAGQALALHQAVGHPTLADALDFEDANVRRAAVLGLQRIGPDKWVMDLLTKAQTGDADFLVRSSVEAALEKLRSPQIDPPKALRDAEETGWVVNWYARQGRPVPQGEAGLQAIHDALQSDDVMVQMAAADHLGRISDKNAVRFLQDLSRQGRPEMRQMAYRALASIARANPAPIAL